MTTRDIVRMTNQIAEFFHPYPHDEALRETANHLRSFWDPRMRVGKSPLTVGGLAGVSKKRFRPRSGRQYALRV